MWNQRMGSLIITSIILVCFAHVPAFGGELMNSTTNNGSFESPNVGADVQQVPTGWSFSGSACYLTEECAWRPAASDGTQYLLLNDAT